MESGYFNEIPRVELVYVFQDEVSVVEFESVNLKVERICWISASEIFVDFKRAVLTINAFLFFRGK